MGLMTTVAVALAATQIAGGFAAKGEADYNASILYRQAGMIDEQKKLQMIQDDREIRKIMGTTVAATAGKGIELSGSPIAIMIDTRTQLEFDKAVGQYNLDVQKYGVTAQAASVKRQGRTAMIGGFTNALTTMFTASAYKQYGTTASKKSLTTTDPATGAKGA